MPIINAIDWRAGCWKLACPVRREGRPGGPAFPTPIHFLQNRDFFSKLPIFSHLRPEDAKKTVEHPLNECPKCGKSLKDQTPQKRPRVIEDMPDFMVENVCHVNERKWCPDCQTMVVAPLTEALPGSVNVFSNSIWKAGKWAF